MSGPITAVIVGAGHRALTYASYALSHPEELRIVGVADLQEHRRAHVARLYKSRFVVRHIDPRPGHEYTEVLVDLNQTGDMHGAFGGHAGGDMRLVADFVRFIRGEPRSLSCTTIEDSVRGHLIGFRADRARETRTVQLVPPLA